MRTDRSDELFGVPATAIPLRAAFDAADAQDPDEAHVIEVGIPMRDGIHLAADVYLPPAAQRPAPAVVFGTPYDKSTPSLNALEGEIYQRAGYAAVVYDCRGRGKSEGEWRAFVHDAHDGHDAVEWLAAQPWCSGECGSWIVTIVSAFFGRRRHCYRLAATSDFRGQ